MKNRIAFILPNFMLFTSFASRKHVQEIHSISELVTTWHYGKNTGTKPAEIIVFYTGLEEKPITVIRYPNKSKNI